MICTAMSRSGCWISTSRTSTEVKRAARSDRWRFPRLSIRGLCEVVAKLHSELKAIAGYIDRVLTRITVGGSFYLAAICVLPTIMSGYFNVPFYFGGTSLLIVVGVAIDTVGQIESFLLQRHYDGLLGPRAARIRGRGRVGR